MNGTGGALADPRRPERRERVLRRHPGADRPQHRRPVDRLARRGRPRDRPRHRRPHPGRHLRRRHPGVRRRHLRRGDRVVRQRARHDPPDFPVGEEVNLVGSGPIRNMYNPSRARRPQLLLQQHPERRGARRRRPRQPLVLPARRRAPAGNGQPASPTCNGTTVTGVGIQNAIKIMYNAMLMKTIGSSYLKYRTWTLHAAKNLFPGSCTEFNTVKAAWDAVSVPAQSGDPTCTGGTHDRRPPTATADRPPGRLRRPEAGQPRLRVRRHRPGPRRPA